MTRFLVVCLCPLRPSMTSGPDLSTHCDTQPLAGSLAPCGHASLGGGGAQKALRLHARLLELAYVYT